MIFLKYFLYEYIKKELSRQGLAIFEKILTILKICQQIAQKGLLYT